MDSYLLTIVREIDCKAVTKLILYTMIKAIKVFSIVFIILSLETVISTILTYNLSIDWKIWPIFLIVFTLVNFLIAISFLLISTIIGLASISFRYTIIFSLIVGVTRLMLEIFYYAKIYTATDEIFYSLLGSLLFFHLLVCVWRRFHINKVYR